MFFQRMNYVEKEARFQDGTRIFNWDLEHFDKKLLTIVLYSYTSQKPLYHDTIFNNIGQPDVSTYAYLVDVLWCQPIKLIQVVSTLEFHEYWWNDVDFIFFVPSIYCRASEVTT